MKVVVFNSHLFWPPHYETELELISLHLDQGDDVVQVYCDAQYPNCDLNPFLKISTCLECGAFRKKGYNAVGRAFTKTPLPQLIPADAARIEALPFSFQTLEEIQEVVLDGFEIGFAVASSIICILRDPKPDFKAFEDTVRRYMIGSAGTFLSFKRWLLENKPDRVYVFNGRLAHTKAILTACKQTGVTCMVHERGSDKELYYLSLNTTVHDFHYIQTEIIQNWQEKEEKKREEDAERFYTKRKAGDLGFWYSFTKDQQDILPENWNHAPKKVVIFNSSEDEFASLSKEWKNELYPTQLDGIKRMASEITDDDKLHLFLRVHPNLKGVENREKEQLYALQYKHLTVIPAESPVSTYRLMEEADVVITFGSTIGIEAAYWNKVSILAGKTLYKGLGSTYEPKSHQELIGMIRGTLPPLDKTGAKMYGNYYLKVGIPFKYYQAEDFYQGTFNGIRLIHKKTLQSKLIEWFFGNNQFKFISSRILHKIRSRRIQRFLHG